MLRSRIAIGFLGLVLGLSLGWLALVLAGESDSSGRSIVHLGTQISGEIQAALQADSMLATSGGSVRSLSVASGLLVGADCTSHCTPAAYVALPTGPKTFTGTLVSSSSGATTVAQVHSIYAANTNTFTSDDAVLVCTITFPSATQYLTKAFTQSCPVVTGNWLYYGVIASGTTGTATVTGAVTATF